MEGIQPITVQTWSLERTEKLPGLNAIQRIGCALFRIPIPPRLFKLTFRITCDGENLLPNDIMVDQNGVLWRVLYVDDVDPSTYYSYMSTYFAIIQSLTPVRRHYKPAGQMSFYGCE